MTPLTMEQQFKKFRKKKFKTLYEQIPFLKGMEYRERAWWIRYYKLRHTWKTHFNNLHFYPDELLEKVINDKHLFEFKKGTIEYDSNNPIERINSLPWDKPNYKQGYLGGNHQLNDDLDDIEWLFKRLNYDWIHVKLEEINFPDIIDCDFSDTEGCQDCRYRFKCELKV